MTSNFSNKNILLITISSIFFWTGLRIIQGFAMRVVRDILVYNGFNNYLIYFISLIIEISIIIFGINYLFKLLKSDLVSDKSLFKISIILLILAYILNFSNAFLFKFYDMSLYSSNFNRYLEFYSSMYVSIIQLIVEILPYFILFYFAKKSMAKPQPQS